MHLIRVLFVLFIVLVVLYVLFLDLEATTRGVLLKGALKNFTKFTGKHLCQRLVFRFKEDFHVTEMRGINNDFLRMKSRDMLMTSVDKTVML